MTDAAVERMIAELDARIEALASALMRANAMRARLRAQLGGEDKRKTE